MDEILIKDLEVFAKHGVLKEENTLGQKFLISADITVDLRRAGLTDDLSESVDYAKICEFISAFLQEHTFQLIEAAAEHLAQAMLLKFAKIREVTVEIKKPWAPIGLPLQFASVKINRKWHRAVVALGSNLGDKEGYLRQAELALDIRDDCRTIKSASYITTKPYGVEDQPDFLNGAVLIETLLLPEELLTVLHNIENGADRKRTKHWGPRTLDLDIIFYDKEIYESNDLVIPHVDMENREFVVKPLMELCPNYRHPVLGLTVSQLYEKLNK